jgi:asparagine synthase (glutamine-hydrolysing)
LAHERLTIIDKVTGRQPITSEDDSIAILHNGEIYNHEQIKEELGEKAQYKSKSDSESILQLYLAGFEPEKLILKLDGDFVFVIYNSNTGEILVARDPIGIKPLYYGYDKDGSLYFSSEMKVLSKVKFFMTIG